MACPTTFGSAPGDREPDSRITHYVIMSKNTNHPTVVQRDENITTSKNLLLRGAKRMR
jgi:hypothetical protein